MSDSKRSVSHSLLIDRYHSGTGMHTVVSVTAQQLVVCRASVNCNGEPGDNLGLATERSCCINNPNGLAYVASGSESCTPCIGENLCRTVSLQWNPSQYSYQDSYP